MNPYLSFFQPAPVVRCEIESHRPWLIACAAGTCAPTFWFHGFKLCARLLAIPKSVVRAKGDLLASREKEFFAALHQILLVERPGIHEVLQHDHEHVIGKIANGRAFGYAASLTGERKLLCRFL